MEITRDHIAMMQELNSNIKTLLKIQAGNKEEKWITYDETMSVLIKSRTWIQERMKEDVTDIKNVDVYLFKGVDYVKYGKRVLFRQSSLERLKQAIINQS